MLEIFLIHYFIQDIGIELYQKQTSMLSLLKKNFAYIFFFYLSESEDLRKYILFYIFIIQLVEV